MAVSRQRHDKVLRAHHIRHLEHVFCSWSIEPGVSRQDIRLTAIIWPTEESNAVLALHDSADAIAKEFRLGPQLSRDQQLHTDTSA